MTNPPLWRTTLRTALEKAGLLDRARKTRDFVSGLGKPASEAGAATQAHNGSTASYEEKIRQEQATFSDLVNVHELPAIFHYWSNKYLGPMCKEFGFAHPDEFFANHLEACIRPDGTSRFISVGAGNGDTEIRVAALLRKRGHANFVLECQDINRDMLARCKEMAAAEGLQDQVVPVPGDFNTWVPDHAYDAVVANQSLHHVLELEHLYASIKQAIGAKGKFITSDIIGRNGHLRWPEALAVLKEFWAELPQSYRYHHQLKRQEDEFLDWDCSTSGFEGIRAQDVLPLLVKTFHFESFLAFSNIIDPFIDRGFGHNFDPNSPKDLDFIDRVHARDEAEIAAGNIKPTHMFACMSNDTTIPTHYVGHLTPAFCVRPV